MPRGLPRVVTLTPTPTLTPTLTLTLTPTLALTLTLTLTNQVPLYKVYRPGIGLGKDVALADGKLAASGLEQLL